MKKLFIMPVFVLFMSGAASNGTEPKLMDPIQVESIPINVKVDSVNIKAMELSKLLEQL